MWRHHLRTALRSLRRDVSHTALGGLSLAVAIAACILIALFVRDELSYDRAVPNAERIAVLGEERVRDGDTTRSAYTVEALAGALVEEAPHMEAATTVHERADLFVIGRPELDLGAVYADSLFFDVFAHPFLAGDPATALDAPDGLVLTESGAERLFGTARPMGETVELAAGPDTLALTVRGVIADLAETSSLTFEAVVPLRAFLNANPHISTGWGGSMWTAYALQKPGTGFGALQASLDGIGPYPENQYIHVPLLDYRLSDLSYVAEGFGGSPAFLKTFGAIALLILLLGAVNAVNLATARGEGRAQEVGVRKALGSGRGQLVWQFLTESVLLTALAALVGVGLAALVLPWFNEAFVRSLALADLDGPFLVSLAAGTLVVGLASGLYPAVYLSRFAPDRVLRGTSNPGDRGGAFLSRTWMRRGLVVLQFGSAVLLLVGTAVMARQLDYAMSAPLGYAPENVAVVPVADARLQRQPDVLKAALLQSPAIEFVSGAGAYPTNYWHTSTGPIDPDQPDHQVEFKMVTADPDYARTLDLSVVAGRWLDADRPSDLERGVVINRAMVRALGWPSVEAALGREVTGMAEGVIVGVVSDFHYTSFRMPLAPVLMTAARLDDGAIARGETSIQYHNAVVRFTDGRVVEGLADVRATLARLAPGAPVEPILLQEAVDEMYASDTRLAEIFGVFAALAVLIACLGLVGLAAYTAKRRTKEIGVRRVLGASVPQVVSLLSREYVLLMLAGAAFAVPLAVIAGQRWLETFVYRATLGAGTVALVVLAALALAMLTVSVLAARAALADPTRSLRTE